MEKLVVGIPLTQGQWALVDYADYEALRKYNWCFAGGYAYRNGWPDKNPVAMHRQIMGAHEGYELDHANGNKLDNRRCNIRPCSRAQNVQNIPKKRRKYTSASAFKGVTYVKASGKWSASVGLKDAGGGKRHLGTFDDEMSAARAYDSAAAHFYGQFASLNFPDETPALFDLPPKREKTSACPGVSASRGGWMSTLTVNGVRVLWKRYKTEEEAIAARKAAEVEYGQAPPATESAHP